MANLDPIKNVMQGVVNDVQGAVANSYGSMAANALAGAASGAGAGTPTKTPEGGGKGSNPGGNTDLKKTSYIGYNGSKKTGTSSRRSGGSYSGSSGSSGSGGSGGLKVTPGSTPGYYQELGNLYKTAYDQQLAANAAALEEAKKQAQAATDAQIAALADEYAGTNRQLYRDYMENQRVLPQQLASMGYNGGLSESSLLRLGNAYEEGLNENERARLAQETSYQQELARQLYEAQAKTTEANQAALQNWYSQQAALKQMIYQDAQNRAATMAASGDFSEYKNLGFSDSEIAYLKQMWAKMNPGLSGSSSSSSSGGRRRSSSKKTTSKKTTTKKTNDRANDYDPTKNKPTTRKNTGSAPLVKPTWGSGVNGPR